MELSQKVLSDVVVFNKYAKYVPEIGRRETWEELVERNMAMHIRKYPQLKEEIKQVYKEFVLPKKVLPSMRSLQFGGTPIELSNTRIYNCSFTNVDDVACFSELLFNLLCGSGTGYSVQNQHVSKLPSVIGPSKTTKKFLVSDSIEGWADSVKCLMKAYFFGKSNPKFDFRDIRPKGARLVTSGGKAPGPVPLRLCLEQIRTILDGAIGRKLTSLEVHDIVCYLADAVLAGGIRRAACIVLFDKDDMDMLTCKSANWWELNPQRGRANNSVVLHRETTTKEEFDYIWKRVEESNCGEPGIFWTNDYDIGTNPCCEISLRSNSYCNLTETNVSDVSTQEELEARIKAGAFIGTLQAGFTDFHYLRDIWRKTTEEDALLGVSVTGVGSGSVLGLDLKAAAKVAVEENIRVADIIGIKHAKRITTLKPAGSTSCVLGTSSGVHAWHNDYYIRRMRVGKNEALYQYMIDNIPDLVEDCQFKPHLEAVMSFPQKAPSGAIYRTESALDTLERVRKFNVEWVKEGHIEGANRHNVSCTISVKNHEWKEVGEWMWNYRDDYTGIAVLNYDGGTYPQAPFEDCTKEVYEEMLSKLKDIDLSKVLEMDDNTNLTDQAACAGGACVVV